MASISPGFRKKTSLCRQIVHQVATFCQIAVLPFFKHTQMMYASNWSGKTKNFTRYRARYKIFTAKREKSTGSGFTGCVIKGCANTPAKNLSSAFIYHPSDESIQANDMALPSVIFARSLRVLFKASHIFSNSLKSPFALCEGIINKYCQLNGSFWGISCFNVIKTGNPRNPDNSQFLQF